MFILSLFLIIMELKFTVQFTPIYPVCRCKVNRLCTIVALIEPCMVCPGKGNHKLSRMLVCANYLHVKKSEI